MTGSPDPQRSLAADGAEARRLRRVAHALFEIGRVRRQRRGRGGEVRSVLHISPSMFGPDGVVGGGERWALCAAEALAREVPTTLVSFGPRRASQRIGDLRVELYPSGGHLGGQAFDPLSYRFLEQVRKADVVHCHQYRVAVSQLSILASAALGRRSFVSDMGGVGLHFEPQIPVQRCLTALLPLSKFSRDTLPAGVPARVIPGGTTEHFVAAGPSSDPRSDDERRVLYVGRIMRHKGIDALIEGLPQGLGLDVIGRIYDEQFYELLRRLAGKRDIRFIHDASDEQLLVAYREALVTVLPSVYRDALGGTWTMPELLGNVLLESMACATPAICTDVGGMPEVVEHGVTGFVVPPNDPETLRMRIGELAADPARRSEMGRRGRERVLQRFTWDVAARQTLAAYREC